MGKNVSFGRSFPSFFDGLRYVRIECSLSSADVVVVVVVVSVLVSMFTSGVDC